MTVPSYPAPGYPGSAPRSRPTIVTVASYLLYAVAAIQVISAVAVLSTVGAVRSAAADVVRGTSSEGAEGFVVGVLIASAVISLVFGAGFALLSFFNSRGKNVSRIITWVVGGLSLCCLGAGLGGNALLTNMDTNTGGSTGPSDDELRRSIEGATPAWYGPLTTTLTVLALLAILAAVILLALPASNDFFRKPAASGWDQGYGQAPYPGQAYPYPTSGPGPQGQPGQPAPGLPPYPGQQGQPGQPAPGLPPYPGQPPSSGPPSYGPAPSGPPSYGPPPSGPPSYGPPSYGPPSYGPPSSGPPSYGPPPSDGAPPPPPPGGAPPPPGDDDRPPRPPTDPA